MTHPHPRLALVTGLVLLLPGAPAQADFLLDDFEARPERWGGGCSLDRERVKRGSASMRWQADRFAHISRDDIPHDWTGHRALRFWMLSERATGNRLIITFPSEDPETEGGDYFVVYDRVDWSGWREFTLVLDRLAPARSPVGWHQVEGIHFYTRGWGQDKPIPGTVLYLDDMRLLPRTAEELAAIHEQRERLRAGYATPLNQFEALLAYFPRGGDGLDAWRPVGDVGGAGEEFGLTQEWHGARLWAAAPGYRAFSRDFDIDVSAYREAVIKAAVSAAGILRATVTADGERSEAEGAAGGGDLVLPLTGKRLQHLEFGLGGEGARRSACLQCVLLRKPESPRLRVFGNLGRGVMVRWDRPPWGASAYRLYRSAGPISAENVQRATVVRESVPASVPVAFDSPPDAGTWHYAVAPLREGAPLRPGPSAEADAGPEPSHTIVRTPVRLDVDGVLGDWPGNAPRIRFAGADRVFSGQAPGSPDDVGADISLCHDGESLYLGARVTDDVVRHTNTRSWEGDGVVLMLLFSPPLPDAANQRYAVVLNYAAAASERGAKTAASILEDRAAVYPADDKPPAPGRWAVSRSAEGYAVEAIIPMMFLTRYGFDARSGGLGLGLSVYDCDSTDGRSKRETALTWQQERGLYDPRDAIVLRWE